MCALISLPLTENGPCSQQCAAVAGRARCSCFPGFSLMMDGHTCEGKAHCFFLLAVIGAIHSAHIYPLSRPSPFQNNVAQSNKQQPSAVVASAHFCINEGKQTHTAMATQHKSIGAVCPEIRTLFNWMQSLMKQENAALVVLNNASTD